MSGPSASLEESLQRIFRRTANGCKLGLDATERLFDRLELPRNPFPIVHIAGTNGKGSTAAMLSAMLTRAGYRTGRFTSPHLVRFNERFCLDESPIPDEDLETVLEKVEAAAAAEDEQHPDRPITFFEISTAIAVQYFQDQGVDVAVVETGLGGRLDSTSVLTPRLCVITRIGLDHTDWLGDTLEEIAAEKAGIFKPGVPVVLSLQEEEAMTELLREAAGKGCPVIPTEAIQVTGGLKKGVGVRVESPNEAYGTVHPALPGDFQFENIAAAVTAAETLQSLGFDRIDRESVRQGLEQVTWPGRCQVLQEKPSVFLDCAHNPAGMKAFLAWVGRQAGSRPVGILFSACADKDLESMVDEVVRGCERVWVCELDNPRTASLDQLESLFTTRGSAPGTGTFEEVQAQAEAWQETTGGILCIAGSIYLAGMTLGAARDPGERF